MSSRPAPATPVLVLGVEPDQHPRVAETARDLARALGARVVCVHADPARVEVEEHDDRPTRSVAVDPDLPDDGPAEFPPEIAARMEEILAPAGVDVALEELPGEPAVALARAAERLDASMIVVGTRRPGVRGAVSEFLDGSVAVHLSHRQHRPVVVVPQTPVANGPLPWEGSR